MTLELILPGYCYPKIVEEGHRYELQRARQLDKDGITWERVAPQTARYYTRHPLPAALYRVVVEATEHEAVLLKLKYGGAA